MEKGCGIMLRSLGRICTSGQSQLFLGQKFTQPVFTEHPLGAQHHDRFYLGLQRRAGNTYTRDGQSPVRDRRMDI